MQFFGGRYLNGWKPGVGRDPCYAFVGSGGRGSSATSTVYQRSQCLVRITWMPGWEITFSGALAGQTLDCTPGVKLGSSWTGISCAFLRVGAMWGNRLETNVFWRRAQKNQRACVLPDIAERGKKLDHLFQASLDFHAVWQTCHPTAAAAAEIVTP